MLCNMVKKSSRYSVLLFHHWFNNVRRKKSVLVVCGNFFGVVILQTDVAVPPLRIPPLRIPVLKDISKPYVLSWPCSV